MPLPKKSTVGVGRHLSDPLREDWGMKMMEEGQP